MLGTKTKQDQKQDDGSDKQFHSLPVEQLYTLLGTSVKGSLAGGSRRKLQYGPNDISQVRKRPIILQFLEHFKNFLVIILLFAAVISAFTGGIISAAIIIIIVFISVTIDFFQEYKAGRQPNSSERRSSPMPRSSGTDRAGTAHFRSGPR